MSDLRFFLFGTPRLECDGAPIKLTRRKVTALLAYLAVTGQPHSREAVATLLWPDFDATSAYAYLRNALWMLKQMPLADRVEGEQETLAFRQDEATWVDVARFEAALAARRAHPHPEREACEACIPLLEEAVALYQGDFMAGFTLEDSAAFDEWQFFQAESLRRAYTGALEKLTLWYSPREPETALDYARRWQSCDPLHEGAHRHLMMLYAQLGQRAAALHLYETLIRDLRAQGLAPSDETVALYQRIRAADVNVARASRPREIAQTLTQPDTARTALPHLPTGTVTFLFTDIQGSVPLWEQKPAAMQAAIVRHHAILREGIEANGGYVFKVVGDAFQAAFAFAPQAFTAALAIQRALCETDWGDLSPLCVRMGLHTGPAELTQEADVEDYAVGHTLNRVARVMSAGSGGQILLSQETAALVQHELPPGVALKDLGEHRLKGLAHPEHLFQAVAPGLPANFPPLTTGVLPSHNLPTPSTAFVGRRAELAEVQRLLGDPETRLITLTGPGGIGKTRLSLRAAEASLAAFPDGVFFVPLAAVETPDLIVSTIADVLQLVLYQQSAAAPFAQLVHYLHDKRMLLVLDNLEQALSGAVLLADLVQQTQALKLLVTSRERLNVQGEWVLELRGLRFPETVETEAAVADVTDYGAVRLFIERARRVNHAFAPDAEDMAAIVRICRMVEGMPLGLELAAAWTKLLSCQEIAAEIAVSLDFLSLALRDLPERHQSLRAVFTRSWSLLSKEEQAVYCALAVFRGGCTRAAAKTVAGASLPLLAALVDKSMLYRIGPDRYDIHHVLRQYAEEQLAANPDLDDAVHDRHSAYYLDWLHRLAPALKGPGKDVAFGQLAALEAIDTERENVHAAWAWAVAHGEFDRLHAATLSLGLFCDIRSRFREGSTLFGEVVAALDRPGVAAPPALLGSVLGIQGECMLRLSQPGARETLQRALQVLEAAPPGPELALVNVLNCYTGSWYPPEEIERRLNDSLSFYRANNDLWGVGLTLGVMGEGLNIFARRNREAARHFVQQSLDIRRQIGDVWGMAITLFTLGTIAEWGEAFADARRFYQESLELRQMLKDLNGAAICMQSVGRVAHRLGERDTARRMLQQSLQLSREIGALHNNPDTLESLAQIACDAGALAEARDLLLESCAIRRKFDESGQLMAFTLLRLGNICLELGETEAARRHLTESLALFEQFGPEEWQERAAAALQQVDDGAH